MNARRRGALSALALLLMACVGTIVATRDVPPPKDLPARIDLESASEAFTHEWDLALRDGRVWRRPHGKDGPWELVPPDGRPRHSARREGAAITELHADGLNLVAVDEDGLVYYTKLDEVDWIERWGLPRGEPLFAPRERRALAISHRGPLAGGYEDIDGNVHPISAGVTSLYLLEADGRTLRYADPWLPSGFVRRLCLPLGDRLIAAGLSASASTLFVIDARGRMFTRLADYDTLGENPVLNYTYARGPTRGGERVLPPEHWVEQPAVPGRITTRITILQTGKGNAARELRVEGVDAKGAGGYWKKPIVGEAWAFVATGRAVEGPFADPQAPEEAVLGPRRARDLAGRIERPTLTAPVAIELREFHPVCPPAALRIIAGEAQVDLVLHMRDTDRDEAGRITSLDGTLMIPPGPFPAPIAAAIEALFGGADRRVEAEVEIGADGGVVLERSLAELQLGKPFLFVFR